MRVQELKEKKRKCSGCVGFRGEDMGSQQGTQLPRASGPEQKGLAARTA